MSKTTGRSKVVGDDGKPLVMYHGTNCVFSEFDLSKSGKNHYQGQHAMHFISEKSCADNYAIVASQNGGEPVTMAVHLNLQNPFIIRAPDRYAAIEHYDDNISADVFSYRADGYDGVLVRYDTGVFAVAFHPKQVRIISPQHEVLDLTAEGSDPDSRWPVLLTSASAIADYIESIASDYVDTEFMEDYFHGAGAVLRLVPVADLREGPAEANIPCEEKAQQYRNMPLETMPPIVCQNGEVEDGNHRLRDARERGAAHILAYVIMDQDELEAQPEYCLAKAAIDAVSCEM